MTASITLIQSFTYRDAPEEYSNRYHFTGSPPTDHTGWHDLAVALFTLLVPVLPATVSLVRAYGYLADGDDAVATVDFTASPLTPIHGTNAAAGSPAPGDAAMTVRWKTARLTSKGKPIYLRKYFHGIWLSTGDADRIASAQFTALQAFAAAAVVDWGSTSSQLCGPDGVVPAVGSASPFVTTRTLKRRGKRPPS